MRRLIPIPMMTGPTGCHLIVRFAILALLTKVCTSTRARHWRRVLQAEHGTDGYPFPATDPGPSLSARLVSLTGSSCCPVVYSVGDRKSTRLNSSHVSISYAVFCLKKKKKNRCHT